MSVIHLVRRLGAGVILAGGAAAVLGAGIAHADTAVDINGWTVQTDGSDVSSATLSDPSDSLGDGTQVTGSLDSVPYPLDHSESVDIFQTLSQPPYLSIRDEWVSPWFLESTVGANNGSTGDASEGFFVTTLGGNQVVDLLNVQPNSSSLAEAYNPAVPVVNPDAAGPVDVGGLALASPQDGALFNDLYDAVFMGDAADWSNAATLFGDLLSI
jgi:hypothetical protein